MKPRNARFLDDLLAKTNGEAIYRFIRDGHSDDVAEVLRGLEHRFDMPEARLAFINFTWMMLEARPTRGAKEARKRDKIAEQALSLLQSTSH